MVTKADAASQALEAPEKQSAREKSYRLDDMKLQLGASQIFCSWHFGEVLFWMLKWC